MSACLFPVSFTIVIFAPSKELSRALTLSWALCTLEVRLANLTLSGAKLCILSLPFSYPLPHHSVVSPISQVFPCLAMLLEGISPSLLAHLAGASLGAVSGSDAELLLDTGAITHLPSDAFCPFQPHDFQGKGQSLTLCHYPL